MIKNDPENYLTIGKVQEKRARERNALLDDQAQLLRLTESAKRIFEVFCGGPVDWSRHSLNNSEDNIFASGDWEQAMLYARAAFVAGWQTIETCPKNQSVILQCFWKHQPTSPYVLEGFLDWDGLTWHEQNGDPLRSNISAPAYWQPMPSPAPTPATATEAAQADHERLIRSAIFAEDENLRKIEAEAFKRGFEGGVQNAAESTVHRLRYALQNCVNVMKRCNRHGAENQLTIAWLTDAIRAAELALDSPFNWFPPPQKTPLPAKIVAWGCFDGDTLYATHLDEEDARENAADYEGCVYAPLFRADPTAALFAEVKV